MCKMIAVTNRHLCTRPFLEQIEFLCNGHADAILLREKDLSCDAYQDLAKQVLDICDRYHVPCILHSFKEVARNLNVGSIHVSYENFLKESKKMKSEFDRIGVSVHSIEEACESCRLGASYLVVGNIFETECKKGLSGRGLSFLQEVCAAVSIPVYGIGGMEHCTDEELIRVGAAGRCVMSSAMIQEASTGELPRKVAPTKNTSRL